VIRVVVGELARESVDAVVRPADARLAPVGRAAARLDELGGPRFAEQRRTTTPLEAGAAVVTGGGDLAAGFAVHVIVADERGPAGREMIRRALVSAWQRAGDWGLTRIATPLVGVRDGPLTPAEAAGLLAETFAEEAQAGQELVIMVETTERDAVEAIVRRTRA
jgi:O-acetyl-ADP-ribose deacetylase (regulator of RNase III)